MPHILLADDHAIIRRGLKVLLENYFNSPAIEECASVKDLLEVIPKFPFTHLILDLQLLDGNVIDVLPEIKKNHPDLPVLIYSMNSEEIFGPRTIQLGADSYLNKQSSEQEVIIALRMFLTGQKYISEDLQNSLSNKSQSNEQNPFLELSDREVIVLNYLLQGETVKKISGRLDLKPTTVATYKARIFDKLNVSNIVELKQIAEAYKY